MNVCDGWLAGVATFEHPDIVVLGGYHVTFVDATT